MVYCYFFFEVMEVIEVSASLGVIDVCYADS